MSSDGKNREIEQLRAVSICLVLVAHIILLSPFIYERVVPYFNMLASALGSICFSASLAM